MNPCEEMTQKKDVGMCGSERTERTNSSVAIISAMPHRVENGRMDTVLDVTPNVSLFSFRLEQVFFPR